MENGLCGPDAPTIEEIVLSGATRKTFNVKYNGHKVSDKSLQRALQDIANFFGKDVNVTSGDRDFVPTGGATNSMHLKGKAVDFHVEGMSDAAVFKTLSGDNSPVGQGFKFIRHGAYTVTQGAHLHLESGRPTNQPSEFVVEGLTPETKNKYSIVGGHQ